MLKKFKKKSEVPKGSIASDVEDGMQEAYERELRQTRNKRVKKYQRRYV